MRTFAPKVIETARLTLRPFQLNDADALFQYSKDEEFALFAMDGEPATIDSARRRIERAVTTQWTDCQRFAILREGLLIGSITLRPEWSDMTAIVGYEIARAQWGLGFATEAATAVIQYGFECLGLERIYARVDPRNASSLRVLAKLGMTREGVLRRHLIRRGERVDRVYFGLLRDEWPSESS
ncbi:MAG: GNAT family protein [Dehalococcoidia bacterium]